MTRDDKDEATTTEKKMSCMSSSISDHCSTKTSDKPLENENNNNAATNDINIQNFKDSYSDETLENEILYRQNTAASTDEETFADRRSDHVWAVEDV